MLNKLFKKKTQQQKIIEQLKKKKKQYDKLKEEMKQMTKKLKIEGGRIVPDDTPKQDIKPPQQPIPKAPLYHETEQQTNPEQDIPQDWIEEPEQDIPQDWIEEPEQEIPPLNIPPQYNQQNEQLRQQTLMRQQMEAYQTELRRQAQEQQYQQQMMQQQATEVKIKIELVTGGELSVPLLQNEIEHFVQQVQQSIENNKVIMIGDKFINGSNIVLFYIE